MLLSLATYIILKNLVIGKKFEQEADKFAMDNGHANGIKSFMTKTNNQPSFADTLKYIEDNKEFLSRTDYEKFMSQWKSAEAISNSNEFWDEHPTHAERIKAAEEYLNNQNQESQGQLAIA
jgi:Zn-dependent protease with chaperone function